MWLSNVRFGQVMVGFPIDNKDSHDFDSFRPIYFVLHKIYEFLSKWRTGSFLTSWMILICLYEECQEEVVLHGGTCMIFDTWRTGSSLITEMFMFEHVRYILSVS